MSLRIEELPAMPLYSDVDARAEAFHERAVLAYAKGDVTLTPDQVERKARDLTERMRVRWGAQLRLAWEREERRRKREIEAQETRDYLDQERELERAEERRRARWEEERRKSRLIANWAMGVGLAIVCGFILWAWLSP